MSTKPPSPPEKYYQQPVPRPTQHAESPSGPTGNTLSARRPSGQPSMRTPTQGPGSNVYGQDSQNEERAGRVRQSPVKTLGQRRSSRHGTARERYREASSGSETAEPDERQQHNIRPPSRRRQMPIPRRDSFPTSDAAEPSFAPGGPMSRRGSSGSASGSERKPRGLSFHEAREYMKSGRAPRPDSWHASTDVPVYIDTDASPSAPPPVQVSPRAAARMEEGLAGNHAHRSPPHSPIKPTTEKINNRIGWALFLNSSIKNHLVATLGELIGTTMFLFFAFAGTQVANINSPPGQNLTTTGVTTGWNVNKLLYVSFSFGFSLMVNVWVFFRISGGLFNPAVTLALLLTGAIGFVRALFLFFAQIAGSIAATGLIVGLFPAPANVRTTLSEGLSVEKGLFIEAFLTAELVFTILMLAKEKHKATFIAPVGIGLALFIAELVGVYWTGGSLNPARSIGPCIVTWTWDRTHWIYWLGPLLGTLIAVSFYTLIKALEYEMANPGQDATESSASELDYNLQTRQRLITTRLLNALGYDPRDLHECNDPERGQNLGSIQLSHQKPGLSVYPHEAGGGYAPRVGPFGTPVRRSEDDDLREKERARGRDGYESSGKTKGGRGK